MHPISTEPMSRLKSAAPSSRKYALALHGGAGSFPGRLAGAEAEPYNAALVAILRQGEQLLAAGGTSLDCVEQVVRLLEDEPLFNAGRGSVLNFEGECELDASIMDGRTLVCGAVAATRTVRYPISLARLVMLRTDHVLLAGEGAEQFADEMKVERVAPEFFHTPERVAQWERARRADSQAAPSDIEPLGTVGCVALDAAGDLAAATSTGGMVMKRFGRVGDSPLIGAGTYADNRACAVSCTGKGEQFIRYVVAYDIAAQMRYQQRTLTEAVQQVLAEKLSPGDGGVIAIGQDGTIVMDFNSDGMFRAAADSTGRFEVGLGR